MNRQRGLNAYRREPTDRIPHAEIFSNPEAMQYITGIDPWEKPRATNLALISKYALDVWLVPKDDTPVKHLSDDVTFVDEEGRKSAKWGQSTTWHWDWGTRFKTIDDVLAFDPLADLDYRWMEPVGLDLSKSVEELTLQFQTELDENRKSNGELALCNGGFYNTLFMWPLLTFGWELFSELGIGYPDECKAMIERFAELSRKVYKAWANTDAEVFSSHDDICYQGGPVFNPKWYHTFIYPYYEEIWGYLKEKGKTVVFICDGNVDKVIDDVIACGADGVLSENYTNWNEYKRKHPDKVLIGGGDNRILNYGTDEDIKKMVLNMTELGKDMPGYFYCVGNHISFEVPPKSVKLYLDLCEEYGWR